jgi:putative oxidoreductase
MKRSIRASRGTHREDTWDMKNPLAKFTDPSYALLRIVAGLLFFCHGAQKILGVFGGVPGPLDTLGRLAGWMELVGGPLLMLGLFTVPVAFLCSGEMAVAYFKAHASHGFWPIANHGELAVIYCFLFLYVAARGGGAWSLDALLARRPPAQALAPFPRILPIRPTSPELPSGPADEEPYRKQKHAR